MVAQYWTYVKFDDSTSTPHTARVEDIKDFDPSHPDDFDKEELYKVFWQDGVGSFDGYYDAHIVCMAGKS